MSQVNKETVKFRSVALVVLALFGLATQPLFAAGAIDSDSKRTASIETAKSAETTVTLQPFAKIYLALQGCTSCAACRSVIRQMTKGAAKDGKVSLPSDAVEINYDKPANIPLKKVVGNLAKNRLHNLKLVDVLFDVSGRIETDSDGSLLFTIETTGQQFALSTPEGVDAPPRNEVVRLSAVVQGWRGSDDLTLKLKSFSVDN
jgi:hypothetical protein